MDQFILPWVSIGKSWCRFDPANGLVLEISRVENCPVELYVMYHYQNGGPRNYKYGHYKTTMTARQEGSRLLNSLGYRSITKEQAKFLVMA